jgi:tetratricopeptide (TPR) repeat protein
MELMVAEQHIPYESALFKRGVAQFESNMEAALKILNKHHIPVFISNLVSNEKDLEPFVSLPVDSIQFPSFRTNYEQGLKDFEQGNLPGAEKYFLAANKTFPNHAACNFYLGRIAYQTGNPAKAKDYFAMAIDLDALRFRAPHQMNETIAMLCNKYSNTHLVNAKAMFEAWSPNLIVGDELILEHVHPNLLGYALLSDAFYRAMKQMKIFTIPDENEIAFSRLLEIMPVTSMDSLAGAYKIASLKKSWPFNTIQVDTAYTGDSIIANTEEEKLAYDLAFRRLNWEDATSRLYNYYMAHHELRKAGVVLQTLTLEHPAEKSYYENAANLYGELGENETAVFYFRKAFDLAPSMNLARYLFVLYFKLDRPAEAIPYLDYVINNGGGSAIIAIKKLAGEIIALQKAGVKDVTVWNQIAAKYYQMGNRETAIEYLDKVLQTDNKNKEAQTLLAHLKT